MLKKMQMTNLQQIIHLWNVMKIFMRLTHNKAQAAHMSRTCRHSGFRRNWGFIGGAGAGKMRTKGRSAGVRAGRRETVENAGRLLPAGAKPASTA
jgi:hypothetical protein